MLTLPELLQAMENPQLKTIDLSLARMERLLAALGSPEKRIPPVIHIAGTNGKGSLQAYLRAMFEAGGKRVHSYTSPHLVHFHERIVLAGAEVGGAPLLAVLNRIHALRDTYPSTFFEGTTAAAFQLFADVLADVTLLEVGLGGRLDATNVIASPAITAITPVSRDHEAFLGDNIVAIAGEKAAIMKHGVPCVMGPQLSEAEAAIRDYAVQIGAPLIAYGSDWYVEGSRCFYGGQEWEMPLPSLTGEHQWRNAATALVIMAALRAARPELAVSQEAALQGITQACWPARLQHLRGSKLEASLPAGSEVWLDGGHNEAAGRILADWLDGRNKADKLPAMLVCGMMGDKDAQAFLAGILPHVQQIYTVPIHGETRAAAPDKLLLAAGGKGRAMPSVREAFAEISELQHGQPCRVLIAGSLYLAGQVLAAER